MKWIKTFFIMIVFILVILFSLQNREEVGLRFGFYPIHEHFLEIPKLPLFLIILCAVFLGVVIGGVGDIYQRFQLKKALRQNEKMIEKLKREVEILRSSSTEPSPFPEKDL